MYSLGVFMETAFGFIYFDILGNTLIVIWKIIEKLILIPFAIPLLLLEYIRELMLMVSSNNHKLI
jgi:hypothetical protein